MKDEVGQETDKSHLQLFTERCGLFPPVPCRSSLGKRHVLFQYVLFIIESFETSLKTLILE